MQVNGNILAVIREIMEAPVLLRIPFKKKAPPEEGFPYFTYEYTQNPDYKKKVEFAAEHENLAVLLGPASGNIVTIDCDNAEMLDKMMIVFPDLGGTLCTYGAHGGQIWFQMEGDYIPKRNVWLKQEGKDTIEFRGGGGLYSLISGMHPDGVLYKQQWRELIKLTWERLIEIKKWVIETFGNGKAVEDKKEVIDRNWAGKFPGVNFYAYDWIALFRELRLRPRHVEGNLYNIVCPWNSEHSKFTGEGATSIFLGDEHQWTSFDCKHAHCDHRHIGDLMLWAEAQYPGIVKRYSKILEIPEQSEVFEHKSFVYYYKKPIDHSKTLLGNRWLCRGSGAFVVAASGVGKSVWVAQASILWSLGLPAFGIEPAEAYRILICQNEDDEGDMSEMAQIIQYLDLDNKLTTIDANTSIVTPHTRGDGFAKQLPALLEEFEPDILIINPYTGFAPEVMEPDKTNIFLRDQLSPVIQKFNCGCIAMHHNTKPQKGDKDRTLIDYSYSMAGWSFMTNWARAILTIVSTDDPNIFKFVAAKRGQRIGWNNQQRYYCHSDGRLLWEEKPQDEIDKLLETAKEMKSFKDHDPDVVLNAIPLQGIRRADLATLLGIAPTSVQRPLDKLEQLGKIKKTGFLYRRV